jgi:hypothetical protein
VRSLNSFLPRKQKKRLNEPPANTPWIWITRELLESSAYRSLSGNACHALARIACEHMNHAGLDNGRLKVTYNDFVAYGIRRNAIKRTIGELVASGFVAIAKQGRLRYGEDSGTATEFRLTWLPVGTEADFQPATNQWKNFSPGTVNVTGPGTVNVTGERNATRQTAKRKIKSPGTVNVTGPGTVNVTGERNATRQTAKRKIKSPGTVNVTTYNIFPEGTQRAARNR